MRTPAEARWVLAACQGALDDTCSSFRPPPVFLASLPGCTAVGPSVAVSGNGGLTFRWTRRGLSSGVPGSVRWVPFAGLSVTIAQLSADWGLGPPRCPAGRNPALHEATSPHGTRSPRLGPHVGREMGDRRGGTQPTWFRASWATAGTGRVGSSQEARLGRRLREQSQATLVRWVAEGQVQDFPHAARGCPGPSLPAGNCFPRPGGSWAWTDGAPLTVRVGWERGFCYMFLFLT